MKKQKFLAQLSMVITTMIWGITFVMVKDALNDAPPFIFLALRKGLAFIAGVIYLNRNIKKTDFSVHERPISHRKGLINLDPLSAEKVSGVDKRTVERMRRGKLAIDARLDLHGEYQATAEARLESFIIDCFEAGCRLVLVITGKGLASNSTGVLRKRLPDWLNKPKCREVTLSFCAARPEHGGEGAFYILLRRKRHRRK